MGNVLEHMEAGDHILTSRFDLSVLVGSYLHRESQDVSCHPAVAEIWLDAADIVPQPSQQKKKFPAPRTEIQDAIISAKQRQRVAKALQRHHSGPVNVLQSGLECLFVFLAVVIAVKLFDVLIGRPGIRGDESAGVADQRLERVMEAVRGGDDGELVVSA
jgi:hypothetical protein